MDYHYHIWSLMIFVFYFLMALHVIILAYGSNSLRVFLCFSIFQWGSILLTWDANVHTRRHTCTYSIGPGAPLQQPLQKKEHHCPHCHQFFNAINWPQLQLLTVEKWEQTFQEPDRISKGFTVRGNSLGRINLSSRSELGIVLIGEKVLAMVWQSSHLNGEVICMVIVRFFIVLVWDDQPKNARRFQRPKPLDLSICPSSRVLPWAWPASSLRHGSFAPWWLMRSNSWTWDRPEQGRRPCTKSWRYWVWSRCTLGMRQNRCVLHCVGIFSQNFGRKDICQWQPSRINQINQYVVAATMKSWFTNKWNKWFTVSSNPGGP